MEERALCSREQSASVPAVGNDRFQKKNSRGSQAYLVESRQGHDGVHQVLSAQVDQHRALTSVEKMQLEGYQLC